MSAKTSPPELKKFMEKRLSVRLNGKRVVTGRLRGFDNFMNIVLDETVEEVSPSVKHEIGLVVSWEEGEHSAQAVAGVDGGQGRRGRNHLVRVSQNEGLDHLQRGEACHKPRH